MDGVAAPVSGGRGLLPGSPRASRALSALVVLALLTPPLAYLDHRSHHARVPLHSLAVGIGAGGERVLLPLDAAAEALQAGTRALVDPADPVSGERAEEQRRWLAAGTVPGQGTPHADMVRSALLDLNTLTLPNGAAVAAWSAHWRYVWPRDASFVAAALSRTGHHAQAVTVLEFVQDRQSSSGVFEARYLPDRYGVPDSRGTQTDGTGWVLWAVDELYRNAPSPRAAQDVLERLGPLVRRSTDAALRLTAGPDALPRPDADYWEVSDERLSLGTAAPLAFGLEVAARLHLLAGDYALSRAARERMWQVRRAIRARFGPDGYPRYLGDDARDTSVGFLLPPFSARPDPEVVGAWREAARTMARPAGGLAPGAGWKDDGISWTPTTAFFALNAAAIGERAAAEGWLWWLSAHRTRYGALPEKVLSDGRPAGPAPVAWTSALVVLAADTLDDQASATPP